MNIETQLWKRNYVLVQFPDIHIVPSSGHAAFDPHLHVSESHLFEISSEQAGVTPHIHVPETQAFDNPVQSALLLHSKILTINYQILVDKIQMLEHILIYICIALYSVLPLQNPATQKGLSWEQPLSVIHSAIIMIIFNI